MVSITEREADVLISTDENDIYVKKGTARAIVTDEGYTAVKRKGTDPSSLTPIFRLQKIGDLESVKNSTGDDISVTDLNDLLIKTADFFAP